MSRRHSLSVYKANSHVGINISTYGFYPRYEMKYFYFFLIHSNTGNKNAIVFPEPVRSRPTTSYPS